MLGVIQRVRGIMYMRKAAEMSDDKHGIISKMVAGRRVNFTVASL